MTYSFAKLQQMNNEELHALDVTQELVEVLQSAIEAVSPKSMRAYQALYARFSEEQRQKIDTITQLLVPVGNEQEASHANRVREDRSNFIDSALDQVHQKALGKGIITQAVYDRLNAAIVQAEEYHAQKPGADKTERFARLVEGMKDLSDDEKLALSRVMAVDSVVINAVRNYENATQRPAAKERFKSFLTRGLKQAGESEEEQKAYLASVKETLDQMLISMVYTMHPTIFHTAQATEIEREMTEALEGLIGSHHRMQTKSGTEFRSLKPNELLPDDLSQQRQFEERVGDLLDLVKAGRYITPFHKITVAQETEVEKEFHSRITRQLEDVIASWNDAVTELAALKSNLTSEFNDLHISAERQKTLVEFRTWGRSADADGREKATSIELGRALRSATNAQGVYEGPALDMRQNSEVHRDFFSALVQKSFNISNYGTYNNKRFFNFCRDFMQERNSEDYKNGKEKYDPERSVYQELTPNHQREFVAEMLKKGVELIPAELREKVRQSVKDFNACYYDTWDKFVETHKHEIRRNGFNPNTVSFLELGRCYVSPFKSLKHLFREELETANRFSLKDSGLGYQRAGVYGEETDFLDNRVKLGGNGEHKRIDPDERVTLMDVLKRLMVINDAIDTHGTKVADRYQIANFEQSADFYIALKLFQEAGLVTIENGQVTNVKMGIQPLLETELDMRNAPKIFKELLSDPLIESYYLKRGQVDLMLGFSDGAKSAGNFASQWRIRQTAEDMTRLFEEHFSQPKFQGQKVPRLRILQGRGRGVDRGGTIDPSLEAPLFPDNVNKLAYTDVTIQSDLPHQMGISDSFGRDYLASKFMGVILGRQAALQHEKDPEHKAQNELQEQAINWIATRASQHFNNVVRSNPDTLKYLDTVPENKERSSREPKRGDETSKNAYDARRAISIEYGFNTTDLPAHQVGLKKALEEFSALSAAELQQQGVGHGEKSGAELLKELHKHPFFRSVVEVAAVGMQNHDPNVARMYAKFAGTEKLIDNCCEHLDGLGDTLGSLRRPASFAERKEIGAAQRIDRIANAGKQSLEGALDLIAHAVLGTFGVSEGDDKSRKAALNPKPSQNPQKAEIIKNLIFTSSREVAWRPPTPNLQVTAAIAA